MRAALATLLILLTGCSSATPLLRATVADAERASQIAAAHNDVAGVACAEAIKAVALKDAAAPPLEPAGPLSAYMMGRQLHRRLAAGMDESVKIACAPLIVDAEKLLMKLGLAAAPGGGIAGSLLGR